MNTSPQAGGHESPSLASPEVPGQAYELKFDVDEAVAARVEEWARRRLAPDPHADSALGGAYRTTTLYFDTPALDVYHRTTGYRTRKFRVRRYGMMTWVFLERKTKRGDAVRKRRAAVPDTEVAMLAEAKAPPDWAGAWFHRRVHARGLRPACRIAYLRTAHVGDCAEGALRLTLDREVRGVMAQHWRATSVEGGLPLLHGRVILELKFLNALPLPFKELVEKLSLAPSPVSKYRLCVEAWGMHDREKARA